MKDTRRHWEQAARSWRPSAGYAQIETIDVHTAGEPLRIIVSGLPEIVGNDTLSRRRFMHKHLDRFRKILMWEPRGHADMYGCVIIPAASAEADFGVLFLHNEGYSSMCGHGIIAVTKAAITVGLVAMAEPITTVRIDTPAGLVTAYSKVAEGVVTEVSFDNVPSFVVELDRSITVEPWGTIQYDLAFGGAYYAYVDAQQLNLTLNSKAIVELIAAGRAIKQAIANSVAISHPFHSDLSFLYGTIFVGPPENRHLHSRNVCVFADGEVDRSPTGTGVSGRAAIEFARERLRLRQPITIESILGTTLSVQIVDETKVGKIAAILPQVSGQAHITGRHQFLIDPTDPLADGFLLR